jgi:hypothetical protein
MGKEGRLVLSARPHLGIPALYLHDLTGTPDAERLLNQPPALIHPESPKVLPRLRHWNPGLASQFEEKQPAKKMPFKLLTTSRYWYSTPGYFAISYCWQGEDWEVPSRYYLKEENWKFPITPVMLQGILRA